MRFLRSFHLYLSFLILLSLGLSFTINASAAFKRAEQRHFVEELEQTDREFLALLKKGDFSKQEKRYRKIG